MAPRDMQAAPAVRALYLAGAQHKRVDSTEAALVVENQRRQVFRYPVARLARVVCNAHVDWTGSALVLCQQAHVPITWIDKHGEASGTLFPRNTRQLGLHHMLEVVLESERGVEAFGLWQQHRRMQVMQDWAELHSLSPKEWEEVRRLWVYQGCFNAHLPLALHGLCMAQVAAEMAKTGLQPTYLGPQAQPIALLQVLTGLTWAHMNLCAGPLADQAHDPATQVALMERWQTQQGGMLVSHLLSLQRWASSQMQLI
jgi:hypothetical protein